MTHKSVAKEKINIIMICVHAQLFKTTIAYCGIAHPGHNSKSGQLFEAVFHFLYIISSVYSKPCQIIARKTEINIISLVKRIFYSFIY